MNKSELKELITEVLNENSKTHQLNVSVQYSKDVKVLKDQIKWWGYKIVGTTDKGLVIEVPKETTAEDVQHHFNKIRTLKGMIFVD